MAKIVKAYPDVSIDSDTHTAVSMAVVHRLPRYFRYLREVMRQGKERISSRELAHIMHITASQVRQDFNCFGGFGQQGYGYNVAFLYDRICRILGVNAHFSCIIIGVGDMGRALVRSPLFEKRGVQVIGLFDIAPTICGRTYGDLTVQHTDTLNDFCQSHAVDFAVLTVPKTAAEEVALRLGKLGIRGIWNFTGKELSAELHTIAIENVHLGDSLMTLTYRLTPRGETDDSPSSQKGL